MSEARIIKRYANRKLYDTQHSRYVTLEQISEMIRQGDDVKIIDNKSKDDLTSVTLAQIIFEEEKKQKSFLPLQAMRNIIATGGESISQFVTQAQRRMTNILPRKGREGEEGEEELGELAELEGDAELAGLHPQPASEDAVDDDAAPGRARDGLSTLREFREWILHSQQMIDEWQRKVDGRIRHVVEGISPLAPLTSLQRDVQGLATRIAELEEKLSQLAARRREQQESAEQPTPAAPEKVPVDEGVPSGD
jgi:polyhydroxyalkanoate synthesis repressor PhaR